MWNDCIHSPGESDPDLSPSHIHLPEGLANQSVTQYTVFCQKRRDIIRREHPGYTQQQIFQILAKQWSELDEEQRSKFIPMGSDVKNLSQIMSPVLSDSGESISFHFAAHMRMRTCTCSENELAFLVAFCIKLGRVQNRVTAAAHRLAKLLNELA